MSTEEWLLEIGVDPDSVSLELKALIGLCDNASHADMLRTMIALTEDEE